MRSRLPTCSRNLESRSIELPRMPLKDAPKRTMHHSQSPRHTPEADEYALETDACMCVKKTKEVACLFSNSTSNKTTRLFLMK